MKQEVTAKKVFIRTLGCQMNDRDSEALIGLFLERGYLLVNETEEADVILVNTCSVRDHAENRAISFLGSFKKLYEQDNRNSASRKIIGLIGCMAKRRGEEILKKMSHLDLVCGPARLYKIPAYIEKIKNEKIRIIDIEDNYREEEFYSSSFRFNKDNAQVVISTGCSNYCSYCVVPHTRGDLHPRQPQDIIEEIKRNVSLGIKKITLLGQNVNDYIGHISNNRASSEVNFVELLKIVDKIDGIEEINFITAHPRNTSVELFHLMADSKKIKKHLHIPFQSGSDRILQLMNRGYTKNEYLKLAADYKKIVKGTLSTDVIAGFPSETEEDFLETVNVIEQVKFSCAYIFKYSPRPGTASLKFSDDVPQEIKERRHKQLLTMQKGISINYKTQR